VSSFDITKINAPASIGIGLSGFRHETTADFRRHVIKRHGDPGIHGRATIIDTDFTRIPDIIRTPDTAIVGTARKGRLYIEAFPKLQFWESSLEIRGFARL
jgi:hypothetical protein